MALIAQRIGVPPPRFADPDLTTRLKLFYLQPDYGTESYAEYCVGTDETPSLSSGREYLAYQHRLGCRCAEVHLKRYRLMSTFWRTLNKLLDLALIRALTYINAPDAISTHDVVTAFEKVASQRLPKFDNCPLCNEPPPFPFRNDGYGLQHDCLQSFLWFCPGFEPYVTNNLSLEIYVWLLFDQLRPKSGGDSLIRFLALQDSIGALRWHWFGGRVGFPCKWSERLKEQEKELRVTRGLAESNRECISFSAKIEREATAELRQLRASLASYAGDDPVMLKYRAEAEVARPGDAQQLRRRAEIRAYMLGFELGV